MSFANIFAGILFGGIGTAAFIYGKKQASWKPMVLGVVLMIYPYFVVNTLAQYVIGTILTLALFISSPR